MKQSIFAKTPRGVKNGTMSLARNPNGGFYNPKTFRAQTKIEVEEVLAM
jgi:hypothetical protein